MQWHFCLYYLAYFVHFYIVPSFVILDIDELDEWFKTHLFHYLLTPSIIGLSIRHCPSDSTMSDFWYTTQVINFRFQTDNLFFVISVGIKSALTQHFILDGRAWLYRDRNSMIYPYLDNGIFSTFWNETLLKSSPMLETCLYYFSTVCTVYVVLKSFCVQRAVINKLQKPVFLVLRI